MRRVFISELFTGDIQLPPDQGHHLVKVLRMSQGDSFEAFDATGTTAAARITAIHGKRVIVTVEKIHRPTAKTIPELSVASTVPKGPRADWMVEKLSELGTTRFIPLLTQRSIVQPEGRQKLNRWQRLARESAEQSKRSGVMAIEAPVKLDALLQRAADQKWQTFFLSLDPAAHAIMSLLNTPHSNILLLIGPEGGWTEAEESAMALSGAVAARLTDTCLRIETAAIVAAAITASHQQLHRAAGQ